MSDAEGFKKLQGKVRDEEMKLTWLYLSDTVSDVINKSETGYKGMSREYCKNLIKIFDSAPMNSVFLVVDGDKNISKLSQLRREFSSASKCGDFKKCSQLGEKISKEEYKYRQYPFWVCEKNSKSVSRCSKYK